MPVRCRIRVDGVAQGQLFDNCRRTQIEYGQHDFAELLIGKEQLAVLTVHEPSDVRFVGAAAAEQAMPTKLPRNLKLDKDNFDSF